MKSLAFFIIALSFMAAGCSGGDNADREKIEAAARQDAAKVAEAPEGSMQREQAVLAIRVREEALREAGHNEAADIYIEAAGKILIDSLRIIEP